MKLKLNFLLGGRTINNRYYDPEMLKGQLNELFKNGKVAVGPDSKCINEETGQVPEDRIVGFAEKYEIASDGTILFDISELSEQTEKYLTDHPEQIKISIFGFGSMDEQKNVKSFSLTSLFMATD